MIEKTEVLFWGALLRAGQAAVEASPTLLCGLFVAGVFRRMLGEVNVLRLFGGNSWRSLPQAWLLGMLLPICSIGAFPVLRVLRRAGVTGGTILAFALAAPLFNPLSFLYGLTLSRPLVIFSFGAISFMIVALVGTVWDRLFANDSEPKLATPRVAFGANRLLAIAADAARELVGPTMAYTLVALVGVALLAFVLPSGSMQSTMARSDPWAPVEMAAVATPAYHSPINLMMKLGLMFEHGNSVSAALTLLILGAGVNLGTLAWVWRNYGLRPAVVWFSLLVSISLLFAYASAKPLTANTHEEPHTHTFDDLCAPFSTTDASDARSQVLPKLAEKMQLHEAFSLVALGCLGAVGFVLRLNDRRARSADYLQPLETEPAASASFWNRPLPAPALAIAALLGLFVFSVVSCYVYYPPVAEAFNEIYIVRGEALSALNAGDGAHAIRQIKRWDDLTRRLEVGVYLRRGRLEDQAHERADELRELLEGARDAILQERIEDARAMAPAIERAHRECRTAFERL